jgi:hypothetical protein
MADIFQIKITLKDTKPTIWRRLLVGADTELSDLHKIIQTAMGWTNSHLHAFRKGKVSYCGPNEDDDKWDSTTEDYSGVTISDLLVMPKKQILYEYDFGDGWNHEVLLEKILPTEKGKRYPVCVAGKRSCPPEDCGGPWGYENLQEIIKDPKHEEYKDIVDWLSDDFDPEEFNVEGINEALKEKDFGCIDLSF